MVEAVDFLRCSEVVPKYCTDEQAEKMNDALNEANTQEISLDNLYCMDLEYAKMNNNNGSYINV